MEENSEIRNIKTKIYINKCIAISWFIALILVSFQKIVLLPKALEFLLPGICVVSIVFQLIVVSVLKAKEKRILLNYHYYPTPTFIDNNKILKVIITTVLLLSAPAMVTYLLYSFRNLYK